MSKSCAKCGGGSWQGDPCTCDLNDNAAILAEINKSIIILMDVATVMRHALAGIFIIADNEKTLRLVRDTIVYVDARNVDLLKAKARGQALCGCDKTPPIG